MTVYSEFQPLETVVVGRLFPVDEYLQNLNLAEHWKNNFSTILTKATEELENLVEVLENRNITVHRPTIYPMQATHGFYPAPLACRDWFLRYGDDCLVGNEAFERNLIRTTTTGHLYDRKHNIPTENIFSISSLDKFNCEDLVRAYFHTCNIVRLGKDLFVSGNYELTGNKLGMQYAVNWFKENFDVRIHVIENATDHLDSHIHIVKPGVMLSILTKDELPDYFKNWTVIECNDFDKQQAYGNTYAYKFKKLHPVIAKQYASFMEANPEETMFNINALSINENTILIPGFNAKIFDTLEEMGVECISVDFRAVSFFDCGVHCATNELDRIGPCEDYR
jgi:N-dimethylarginine dimethylaminohydrolase